MKRRRNVKWYRTEAHNHFDRIWTTGLMERQVAYELLKKEFGKWTHMKGADIETCKKVIVFSKKIINSRKKV